ncbi:MAG: ABC transporter ATP-binding protein [Clostridiales bacterium]|nr:ABC transporter ATP-binding protein [Clostridiales bacterium]
MAEILMNTKDLSIHFGAHKAVDGVSINIEKGLFTTVLGPNGAGKTTIFNLISGLYKPTRGKVLFRGEDITKLSPIERINLGLARSFQLTNVFPTLTAYENIRLAVQAHSKIGCKLFMNFNRYIKINDKSKKILEEVLLYDKKDFIVATLSHGEQRKLELGMVLALEPEILLLDEPTAGMAIEEVPTMLDILKNTKEKGTTILLIEHKMDMVKQLSDKLIVIVNGKLLAQGDREEVANNPEVMKAYLGGGMTDGTPS